MGSEEFATVLNSSILSLKCRVNTLYNHPCFPSGSLSDLRRLNCSVKQPLVVQSQCAALVKTNLILSMMDSCYCRKCPSKSFSELIRCLSRAEENRKLESCMALHGSGNGRFPSLKTVSLYRNGVMRQDWKGRCYFL